MLPVNTLREPSSIYRPHEARVDVCRMQVKDRPAHIRAIAFARNHKRETGRA